MPTRRGSTGHTSFVSVTLPVIGKKRNKWTVEEINFVGEWCAATLLRTPNNQHNIVARCLAYIQNHSDVAMIFHPSHILSSGRLKHGLESYKKKEQEETNKDILL